MRAVRPDVCEVPVHVHLVRGADLDAEWERVGASCVRGQSRGGEKVLPGE